MNWYLDVLKTKYAKFDGRARRTEFWMFALFNFIVAVILGVIDAVLGTAGIIGFIYMLAVLVPGIALTIRRLHDTGRPGLWILIALVPVIGTIVLLVFMVLDSQPGANDFGPNPKGA